MAVSLDHTRRKPQSARKEEQIRIRVTSEQKQVLQQNLSEIKSDVKQIGQAVQTLTLQVQLSQQQPTRRP